MKRLMTLVVVVMVMTAAYAQKRTNYKFKFEYAVEIESETKADCNIVFDIIDRPGESPMIKMVNNSNGEVNNEEMKPMVVFSSDKEIIYFSNADGDTLFGIIMQLEDNGAKSCVLYVIDVEDGGNKIQYSLTNETGSPNDEQCTLAYNALLKSVKANSFNNYTVETID